MMRESLEPSKGETDTAVHPPSGLSNISRKAGSPASLAASATCLQPQEHNMAPSAANKKTERRNIFI